MTENKNKLLDIYTTNSRLLSDKTISSSYSNIFSISPKSKIYLIEKNLIRRIQEI